MFAFLDLIILKLPSCILEPYLHGYVPISALSQYNKPSWSSPLEIIETGASGYTHEPGWVQVHQLP